MVGWTKYESINGRIVMWSPSLTRITGMLARTHYVFKNTMAAVKNPRLQSLWTLRSSSPHTPQLPPSFLAKAVCMALLGFALFSTRVDLPVTPVQCGNILTASSPHNPQPKHQVLSGGGIPFGEDTLVSHRHTNPEQTGRPWSARPIPAGSTPRQFFSFQKTLCAAHRNWH